MRVVFMGTPAFAESSLRALCDAGFDIAGVVSQPARPAGRGRQLVQPPVAELALSRSLPLIQPPRPHAPDVLETLRAWAPDVIVVAAYGHILRPAILNLPPKGCINVHASLLPRYRGASPIPMALLAGESETGVTIMLLDEGTDTGPILAQRAVPILDADTTGSLTEELANAGAELLVATLPAWLAGQIAPQPQDERLASYCQMLRKEDGRLDWSLPARQLWRRVRAFDPWPGTHTLWRGELLKVLEAWPADEHAAGAPGLVVQIGDQPAVIAGEGTLLLKRLQLAGKKPIDGAGFARGQRDFVGSILG